MGRRAWLDSAIASHYLPFLAALADDAEGRTQADDFNRSIRESWSKRGLVSLSQQQSLMDSTRRAIKDQLGMTHFSLDHIRFSTDEYIALNDLKQGRVAARNERVLFLDDPDAIVAQAIALLASPEWADIAAGLSVLTGRRSSELLSTAQFSRCSDWTVTFTGSLKRRDEKQVLSFEIPTLAPAVSVCDALERVRRSLPEAVGLDATLVNSRFGAAVIRACDLHFADLVPLRDGKDTLYTHLFRSVYATIATFWFCPPRVNDVEFKAAIQGHYAILDEQNPERRRSLMASRHYSDFEIADSVIARFGGRRKGILLDKPGVQVIDCFREQVDMSSSPPTSKRRKKLGSVRIWRDDKVLLDDLFDRLGFDSSLNQSEKMGQLLLWVRDLLDSPLPHTSQVPPSDSVQKELALDTDLADEVEDADEAGESTPIQVDKDSVFDVSAPLSSPLEAKLDRLVDVLSQFLAFQMGQGQSVSPSHTSVTSSPTLSSQGSPSVSPPEDTARRSPRSSPNAEALIHKAIDALIQHNNSTELHDLKWAISINTVKDLVSHVTKSQRLVARLIAQRQSEVDSHHSLHHIQPNHNHRHKRKRTVTDVIHL